MSDRSVPSGFKETEIGLIPVEWEVVRLGEIADVRGGTAFPHKYQGQKEGKYPFYKVSDMNLPGNETHMRTANNWVGEETVRALRARPFPKDTIIFPKVGGAVYTNKKRLLITEALVDNNVMGVSVREKGQCVPEYLFYWFESIDLRQFSNPGPLPSITARAVKKALLPLPPFPEQRRIAHVLSTIQRAIAAQDAVIAAARELKRSLMQRLFTYGPGPEPAPTRETEIGEIPEHWEVVRLGEIAQIVMGQSPPGSSYNQSGDGIPLINGPAEFGDKFPVFVKWTSQPTKVCRIGDILFCVRGNTTGRMNIADGKYCIGRGVASIRGVDELSDTSYLLFLLEHKTSEVFNIAVAGGSTFPNITKGQLEALKVPSPPLAEQQEIAHVLSAVDYKIETEKQRKAALQALFKSMLHQLMTGQVRV